MLGVNQSRSSYVCKWCDNYFYWDNPRLDPYSRAYVAPKTAEDIPEVIEVSEDTLEDDWNLLRGRTV